MSRIVEFREAVVEAIRKGIPDLKDVDWFQGVFDDEDLRQWSIKTPAAMITVRRGDGMHHTTGELNVPLEVFCVVIVQDKRRARDADVKAWEFMEKVANIANLSTFKYQHAGHATKIKLTKLEDKDLKKDNIAIGIVEWESSVVIGTNKSEQHEYIYLPDGTRVVQTPKDTFLGIGQPYNANEQGPKETVNLSPPDPAFEGDPDP